MSDRDKKLLIYLGALIILAAAYVFVGRPYLEKIDALSNEKSNLQVELKEKRADFERKAEFEQGITDSESEIQRIMDEFPEDNSDEKSIMFISHAEAEVPIWFSQVKFATETKKMINGEDDDKDKNKSKSDVEAEAEQEAVDAAEGEETEGGRGNEGEDENSSDSSESEGGIGIDKIMYRDTELGLSFQTTYTGFKNLLAYIRDYEDRMVIKDIDISYNDSTGLVNGSFVLSQYALLGPGRVLPDIETGVEELGTANVFARENSGRSIVDMIAEMYSDFLEKIMGYLPEQAKDELGTDYFVKVNAVTDNTNGKTIGRADDTTESTYITSAANSDENVNFTITGEAGDYSVTYKVGKIEYTDKISKSEDSKIYLRVVSSTRTGEGDESAVTLHVINESDIPVVVNIEGDDPSSPRARVMEKVGDVTVND